MLSPRRVEGSRANILKKRFVSSPAHAVKQQDSSVPAEPPPPAWMTVAMLWGVLCLPVLAAVRPVTDADIWWHLRTGQWIVEHGQVTETDPFSMYGADRPWIAYSWLFEIGVYQLYQWLGLAGVIVYRVLMAVAVVAAFQR